MRKHSVSRLPANQSFPSPSTLQGGIPCRINLIRFHAIPDSPLRTSSPETIAAFQARLQRAGITTTLRASRGEDILAACGLLAGKGLRKPDPEP